MGNEKKYFITNSNFNKVVGNSKSEIYEHISMLYEAVYDKADLSDYLSKNDADDLNRKIRFLATSEDFLMGLLKNKEERNSYQNSNSSYLFSAGNPRYHVDSECKTLKKDFVNFSIPKEITDRGREEVVKFKQFATENRKLLNDGREDLFILKIENKFLLKDRIDKVVYENSGAKDIKSEVICIGLDQLENSIELSIKKLESFRLTEEGALAFKNFRYSPIKNIRKYHLTNIQRDLLEEKRNLVNLILQYNKVKYKNDGSSYSSELLDLYGFKPCGICCGEGFDLSL